MIRTMMSLGVFAAVALVACGPEAGGGAGSGSASAKKSGSAAAPSAPKSADVKPSATTPPSAATPAKPEVLASCINKDAGTCVEYMGKLDAKAEEECVGKDKKGEFKKGSEACTHTDAIGTCEEKKETGDLAHHFYKAKFDEAAAKKVCDSVKGTWIAEPAAAPAGSGAPSATPAASGSAAPK
jgi:hypothetical protein